MIKLLVNNSRYRGGFAGKIHDKGVLLALVYVHILIKTHLRIFFIKQIVLEKTDPYLSSCCLLLASTPFLIFHHSLHVDVCIQFWQNHIFVFALNFYVALHFCSIAKLNITTPIQTMIHTTTTKEMTTEMNNNDNY